jgi:hypothetical protein
MTEDGCVSHRCQIRWKKGSGGFRAGSWANLVGVKVVVPTGLQPRLCFEAMYADGFVDYVPLADNGNFEVEAADQ